MIAFDESGIHDPSIMALTPTLLHVASREATWISSGVDEGSHSQAYEIGSR